MVLDKKWDLIFYGFGINNQNKVRERSLVSNLDN
jgi:hypothetical protein